MIYLQLLGVQPQLSTSQLLIHSHPLPQQGEKSGKKVKLMDCDKKSNQERQLVCLRGNETGKGGKKGGGKRGKEGYLKNS